MKKETLLQKLTVKKDIDELIIVLNQKQKG